MLLRASRLCASVFLTSLALTFLPAMAGPFVPGDLVVYRVGTGAGTLTNAATAVFLDEFTTDGTLVQSLAMPTTVNGNNRRLTAAGDHIGEGQLNLSVDGRYITLTGFDAPLGTANVNTTTSVAVNRVVAKVSLDGTIDTSTAYHNIFSQSYGTGASSCIRSSITSDGSTLWVTGYGGASPDTSGLRSGQMGQTASTLVGTMYREVRHVEIYGGQLFATIAGTSALVKVGTGTHTASGQSMTIVPGMANRNSAAFGFFMADLSDEVSYLGTGLDTLYIADSDQNYVTKRIFDGTNFVFSGYLILSNPRGLTGRVLPNGQVEIFTVLDNGFSNDSIVRFIDESGYAGRLEDDPLTAVDDLYVLATAPTGMAYRGIDFIPEPAGTCWVLATAGVMLLRRSRTVWRHAP